VVVRDTFLRAVDAFEAWEDGEPEPTIDLTQACGLVWNCADILPNLVVATNGPLKPVTEPEGECSYRRFRFNASIAEA
jgi:hypothetical protein